MNSIALALAVAVVTRWHINPDILRLNSEQIISIARFICSPILPRRKFQSFRERAKQFSDFYLVVFFLLLLSLSFIDRTAKSFGHLFEALVAGNRNVGKDLCVCSVRKIVVQWRWSWYTLRQQQNYTANNSTHGRNTTIDNLCAFLAVCRRKN